MKTVWAMLCSLLLAGAPLLLAQTSPVCVKQMRACCGHACNMPCCKAGPSSDSQSTPAAPASSGNQTQISLLAPALLIWTLPVSPANSISFVPAPSSLTASAPLFAKNCARLL